MKKLIIAVVALLAISCGSEDGGKWIVVDYTTDTTGKTCFICEYGNYAIDDCSQFDHNHNNKLGILLDDTGVILSVRDDD